MTDKIGNDLLQFMSDDKYASEDDVGDDVLDEFITRYNKIMGESEEYLMNVFNVVEQKVELLMKYVDEQKEFIVHAINQIDSISDPEKQKEEIEKELMGAMKKFDDQVADIEQKQDLVQQEDQQMGVPKPEEPEPKLEDDKEDEDIK